MTVTKGFKSPISLASLNPNKDLVAISFKNTDFSVFRFSGESWSSIWSKLIDQASAIAWNPDGNSIAVASASNVSIYLLETGDTIYTFQVDAKALYLLWSTIIEDSRTETSLYKDPQILPLPFQKPGSDQLAQFSSKPLDILIIGDASGNITFSLYGIFHLGCIPQDGISLDQSSVRIVNATISPCLSSLTLLSQSSPHRHSLQTFNLSPLLLDNKTEITQLASRSSALNSNLVNLTSQIDQLSKDYSIYQKAWRAHRNGVRNAWNEITGIDAFPKEQFHELYATWSSTAEIQSLLIHHLSKGGGVGITRYERLCETNLANILSVGINVHVICMHLFTHLTNLSRIDQSSHSKSDQSPGNTKSHEHILEEGTRVLGELLSKVEEMLVRIDVERACLREWCKWCKVVVEYLNDSTATQELSLIDGRWVCRYLDMDESLLDEFFNEGFGNLKTSLRSLDQSMSLFFKNTARLLGNSVIHGSKRLLNEESFSVGRVLSFLNDEKDERNAGCIFYSMFSDSDFNYTAIVLKSSLYGKIVRSAHDDSSLATTISIDFSSTIPQGSTILDVQFYDVELLAVLALVKTEDDASKCLRIFMFSYGNADNGVAECARAIDVGMQVCENALLCCNAARQIVGVVGQKRVWIEIEDDEDDEIE